jgi:hypothetical protein
MASLLTDASWNLKVDIISACNNSQTGNIMAEKEMRNFALRDAQGNETCVFTGESHRQAARKTVNRGCTGIWLRERASR